jgi:hypothetical protein
VTVELSARIADGVTRREFRGTLLIFDSKQDNIRSVAGAAQFADIPSLGNVLSNARDAMFGRFVPLFPVGDVKDHAADVRW